jgi:hypothetical protein
MAGQSFARGLSARALVDKLDLNERFSPERAAFMPTTYLLRAGLHRR